MANEYRGFALGTGSYASPRTRRIRQRRINDPRLEAPPSTPSTFTTEGTGSATMEIAIGGHEADGCVSARGVGRQRARRVLPRADGAPPTKG
jgi:hypothetical protein